MYCPQCGKKFWFRTTFCPDCRVGLVQHPPAAAAANADREAPLVGVFATTDPGLAAVAQSLLDGEGIEYMMRGADMPRLGYGAAGTTEFWVLKEDADRAAALLHDLRAPAQGRAPGGER